MKCKHTLIAKQTAYADGLCPLCMRVELIQLRLERDTLKQAIERLEVSLDQALDVRRDSALEKFDDS